MPKILILDIDGVVIQRDKYFSMKYAEEHGVPHEEMEKFFKGVLLNLLKGRVIIFI